MIDIQNHGRDDSTKYIYEKVNDAYVEKDSKIFLCSNLLRSQVGGLFDMMEEGKSLSYFTRKDFSQTGASRTIALDLKKASREWILFCLIKIPDNFQLIFER